MPFDDESAPVFAGRSLQVVQRRQARRSRSVFRTHRPWRRRIVIIAYGTAFAAAGTALIATVSDIADQPPPPPPHRANPFRSPTNSWIPTDPNCLVGMSR